jgi:hypothetical protein
MFSRQQMQIGIGFVICGALLLIFACTTSDPEPGDSGIKEQDGEETTTTAAQSQIRRREKSAFRQKIFGQIKGQGSNATWGEIPGAARVDLNKSSYNIYTYTADVEVQIHKNDGTQLLVDYYFHDLSAMEMISDRELTLNFQSGWLPPGLPSKVTLKDEYIEFIARRIDQVKDALPPKAQDLIKYSGDFLAFRSPELENMQETALGLKGHKVRVTKSVGISDVTGVDFEPTRDQKEFINRLTLTVDMELFPDGKVAKDQWQADGGSLGFIFDPLMPGSFRGPVEIEYTKKAVEEGVESAHLTIRRAPVEFVADDGTARGKFDAWGSIVCLMPARLLTSVNLQGSGDFRGFPVKHLLYGMQYEGAPEFEAQTTTKTIPYKESKSP